MATRKNEPKVTQDYVDTAVDNQRRYTEDLFVKAECRTKELFAQVVDERMKVALELLRPSTKKELTLPQANAKVMEQFTYEFSQLAYRFRKATGLSVENVRFDDDINSTPCAVVYLRK